MDSELHQFAFQGLLIFELATCECHGTGDPLLTTTFQQVQACLSSLAGDLMPKSIAETFLNLLPSLYQSILCGIDSLCVD